MLQLQESSQPEFNASLKSFLLPY